MTSSRLADSSQLTSARISAESDLANTYRTSLNGCSRIVVNSAQSKALACALPGLTLPVLRGLVCLRCVCGCCFYCIASRVFVLHCFVSFRAAIVLFCWLVACVFARAIVCPFVLLGLFVCLLVYQFCLFISVLLFFCRLACLPACLPAFLPACLPA